jgi:hypothetical protein
MNPNSIKEATNEFNQCYKNYLENKLLFNTLFKIMTCLSRNVAPMQQSASATIQEKVNENFWRSFLITDMKESQSNNGVNDESDIFMNEVLSSEAKKYILNRVDAEVESCLVKIKQYLSFANIDLEGKDLGNEWVNQFT